MKTFNKLKQYLSEWIYDQGFNKDELERDPRKIKLAIAMFQHPDEDKEILDSLHEDLEDHYHPNNKFIKQNHFGDYTGDSSAINNFLIDHHYNSKNNPLFFNEAYKTRTINALDKNMDKYSFESPSSFHVYTGIGPGLNVDNHRNTRSDRLYLPAYTSASLEPTMAESFTNNKISPQNSKKPYREIIRLHIPKGSRYGTYLGSAGFINLGSFGQREHEHEFLIHRGTHIQFIGKPRVYPLPNYSEEDNTLVHDARIIRQVRKPL